MLPIAIYMQLTSCIMYSYIHTTLLLLRRLPNNYLILMIRISEDTILRVDMRKAREEIGIALLANSGIFYHYASYIVIHA